MLKRILKTLIDNDKIAVGSAKNAYNQNGEQARNTTRSKNTKVREFKAAGGRQRNKTADMVYKASAYLKIGGSGGGGSRGRGEKINKRQRWSKSVGCQSSEPR